MADRRPRAYVTLTFNGTVTGRTFCHLRSAVRRLPSESR